jgi:hypothetical protein
MPQSSPQPPKRRQARFKRSETSRLLKGAADAGLTVRGLEADAVTGVLRVLVGKPDEPNNDLDSWLKKKDADHP